MSIAIEKAIQEDNWQRARKLIMKALSKEPGSHWLLTRLSTTYYEQRQYKKALMYSLKALKLQPTCPLALWDTAGAYHMLGNVNEASKIYRALIKKGVDSIAYGDCGEGKAHARGIIADSWYRLAMCQLTVGRKAKARESLLKHLSIRGPGCLSIYSIREVKSELRKLGA